MHSLQSHTLDNGLTVYLKEVHAAPVISFWVAYRVGSRNEPTGKTGISHWVEHMMFKGTERFPAGVLDREIDRTGGEWNAFTSMDCTMYYETLPADRIDLALQAERDRMTNALFDPDETESERTVIISERQGSENSPTFWLKEEMRAAAFRVHGYHHMILGDMTDLNTLTRDDLYTHYRQHYTPQNAVIVCVGAFEADEMLQKINDMFGDVPPGEPAQAFVRDEPPQQGERRVSVQRPGDTAVLSLAHRVPEATHADWFALEVLDSVLTGSSSSDNKTTRLYRALVKSGVAASLSGGMVESIDPYLYTINTTLNDGHTPDEAEQIILDEIQQVQQEGISADELTRARKQARASFAYATESITNQAYWLAQSAMLNDIHWFDAYLDRLAAVTLDDVQRVANTYLIPARRTVGTLLPEAAETA